MFENEIQFISDFSHNQLKKFGSFVTYEKLSKTDLHPAILSYISAELDYMVFRDRRKLLEDSIFDYSGREISDHLNIIAAEIKRNKKISISDVRKLIIQAVSFNVNYVVRPKWSATKLIYNDQNFISVDELERMLNYLYYYDYIKNVLSAYISRRKVIQLTITEFDLILNKIDRELFKSNVQELINNALHSIADFFNIGGIDKNRIPLAVVEIFLKDKNLMDYLLKLRKAVPDGSRKKYGIEDIKKILYSTAPVKPESVADYESEQDDIEDEIASAVMEPEDIDVNDEMDRTEPKAEDHELPEIEIISEEKIMSRTTAEEDQKTADEFGQIEYSDAEILPIEDELQEEIPPASSIENEIEIEEEIIIEDTADDRTEQREFSESLFEEDDSRNEIDNNIGTPETDEIIIEEEIKEDDGKVKSDDVLSFYEKELESLDDDMEEVSKVGSEKPHTTENAEDEDKDVQTDVIESENFSKEDFDLTIFEGAEDKEVIDDILENINGNSGRKDLSQRDVTESVDKLPDKENPEEESIEVSSEKRIIDEMLEDYFGTDKSLEDESSNEVSSRVSDEQETGSISASVQDDQHKTEDNVIENDVSSPVLEGNSFDDDISRMLDEIDDILEQNHSEGKEKETENIEHPSQEVEEKKTFDEKILSDDATPEKFIPDEKIKDPVPKTQVPLRDKELLSYLSRKEVRKIVSNVFGGDEEDFVNTIERISEISSYKEATEILKGVFFTYRVSPYSKDAVLLTNAVSHFFRQA